MVAAVLSLRRLVSVALIFCLLPALSGSPCRADHGDSGGTTGRHHAAAPPDESAIRGVAPDAVPSQAVKQEAAEGLSLTGWPHPLDDSPVAWQARLSARSRCVFLPGGAGDASRCTAPSLVEQHVRLQI